MKPTRLITISLLLASMFLSTASLAQQINIEEASLISKNWARSHELNQEIKSVIYKTIENDTLLYIFNFNEAWVMVAADKTLLPILGFSFESQYSDKNDPDAITSLFDFYASVKTANQEKDFEYSQEWEEAASVGLKSGFKSGTVEPLLPVTWNQDWPYNAYCPEDSEMAANFNGRTNSSCGPTAFSQVLRYWKYPERGRGSHSYYYDKFNTTVSANFGSTNYNWDNMPAKLNFTDPESVYKDVANLMYHVGVSINNAYSTGGTLDQYTSAAVGYFGYAPTCRVLYANDYSNTGWHSLFRDDLNNGRPIMIMANKAGSADPWVHGNVLGHYFICDGYYGDDYYHINWGWNGYSNGYYPIHSFGNYIYHNHALIGLEPNYANKELALEDPYTNDNNTVVLMHFDGDLNNESSLSENPSQNGSVSFEDNSSLGLGQSLYLNNNSQSNQSYLAIPDNDNLDLSGDWTIEMWFKANSIGNNWNDWSTLLSKPGNDGNSNSNYSVSISPGDFYVPKSLMCSFYPSPDVDRNTGILQTDMNYIETGRWYHYSFIRNTADKTMRLLIHDENKRLIHYASDSYHAERAENPRLNSNPLYIGFGYYSTTFFNGYIDELRISNIVREPRIASTSVRITEPNGGEKWEPGNYKNIKWVSENVQEIKIEYSTDNGSSWKTVVNSCSANRTGWSWQVPNIQSSECLIKITDISDNSVVDISDGVFTIGEDDITITEVSSTDLLCHGDANGTITITSTGGYSPYQYSINNGSTWQSSNTFSGLSTGSYNIKAKDNNDNVAVWASNPVQVNQASEIIISSVGKDDVSSSGSNDGSITINASGGTGTKEYSIDNGATWQSSNSFSNLSAGSYNIKVKDANGCEKEYENNPIIISEPNDLSVDSVDKSDVSPCFGNSNGSITITIIGGASPYQYSIDNGSTWQSQNSFSGLSAGNYDIKAKDNTDYIVTWASNPVQISQPSEIVISSVGKGNVSSTGANDGSITISASGGTGTKEYSIDNGTTWQSSGSFSNLSTGSYYIKVKDENNCEKEYQYNPVIISGGDNLTIDSVEKTDVTLCFGNLNGKIIINASGGKTPYKYSIDNGVNWLSSNTFNNKGQGSYYIKVKDDDDVVVGWAHNPLILFQPSEIVISGIEKQDASSIGGADGSININATGGTGSFEYSINHGTTYQYTNSFTGLPQGNYYIKVRDANGCGKEYAYNPVILSEPSGLTTPALLFDGTDDYAALTGFSYPSGDLTIEAWIKPKQFGETRQILFGRNTQGAFQFRVETTGHLVYGESPAWTFVSSTDMLKLNEWNHVALVRKNGMCTLYIDGIKSGEGRVDNGFNPSTISIGGRAADMDRFFNGHIVELRIWNLARNQKDIQDNMYDFLNGIESGLLGYWHMNEGEGQKAYDHSKNSNDLLLGLRTSADDYDPEWVSTIWPFESSVLSIYDVQHTDIPGSDGTYPSPFVDNEVKITGIVTAVGYSGSSKNFFISSSLGGDWQGLYVFSSDIAPSIGDMVEVQGLVKEYYGVTQIYSPQVTILSQDNILPDACVVKTGDLGHPLQAEAFEGCLVLVENVTVSIARDELGQWYVSDGSGDCQIDDNIYRRPIVYPATKFSEIIGVLDYNWDEYSITPRFEEDFTLSTGIRTSNYDENKIRIYPNPASKTVYIETSRISDISIFNIAGQKLLERTDFTSGSIDISGFKDGIYFILMNAGGETHSRKLVVE